MHKKSLGPEYESCDWLICDWTSTEWETFNWERWNLKVGSPLTMEFVNDLTNTMVRRIDTEHNDRTSFIEYHGGHLKIELENTIIINLVIKPGTVRTPDDDPESECCEMKSSDLKVGSPLTTDFINDLTYTRIHSIDRDDAGKMLLVVLENTVSVNLSNQNAALSN